MRARRAGILCAGVLSAVPAGGRRPLVLSLLRVGGGALRLSLLLRAAGLVVRGVRRGSRHSFKGTVPSGVGPAAPPFVRLPRPGCWSPPLFRPSRPTERYRNTFSR